MADFEIFGLLHGAFRSEEYSFESDGRIVAIRERRRSLGAPAALWEAAVRWPAAPGEEREHELSLKAWFEAYLLASTVSTGSSVAVTWDGIHKYDADGTWRVGKILTQRWAFVRCHPGRLDVTQALADGVRRLPEARVAAEHLRHAMALLSDGVPAAAAAAYIAVEGLVVASEAKDWQDFGDRLKAEGSTKSAADLLYLWASFQSFRHDPAKTDKAHSILEGRDALDYGQCCWQAAEILEDYVGSKTRGD